MGDPERCAMCRFSVTAGTLNIGALCAATIPRPLTSIDALDPWFGCGLLG